jgi:hypothetical protein
MRGTEYAVTPAKVDRRKLYGWRELVALDENGNECRAASMDESGTLIIPKGGIGLGILSADHQWVERGTLKAVTPDGNAAPLIPSSHDAPIRLETAVCAEEFLDHSMTAVYQLTDAPAELIATIGSDIYTFPYNYRESYEASPAFLLVSEGVLFMLVGYKTPFEMLSLAEAGNLEAEDEADEDTEDDEIDFSMGL